MVQGTERREVVQPSDVAAQNTPLLQGQASSAGSAILPYSNPNAEVMQNLLKFADTTVQTQMQKQKEVDATEGILAFTAGKTEQAIGYNPDALKAYKALEIKSRLNDWVIDKSKQIEQESYQEDPEQFRKGLMQEIDTIQSSVKDPDQRAFLATMAASGLEKVIGMHVVKHQEFVQQTGKNNLTTLLVSSAEADDANLGDILSNVEAFTPTLSDEQRKESVLSAVRLNFTSGDVSIYETLGGMDGMLSRGYSPDKVQQLESAYRQVIEKSQATASILPDTIAEEHIVTGVKSGEIANVADAFEYINKNVKDPKRQAAVFKVVNSMFRKNIEADVLNSESTRGIVEKAKQDLINYREIRPDTLADLKQLPPNVRNKILPELNKIQTGLKTDAELKQVQRIAEKSLDAKYRLDVIDSKIAKYISGDKLAITWDTQTLRDIKVSNPQEAQSIMLDRIVDTTISDVTLNDAIPVDARDTEINKRLVSVVKDFDVVSPKISIKFKNLDPQSFLNAANEIDQSYVDAVELYTQFKKANVSENKIAAYTGDNRDLLELVYQDIQLNHNPLEAFRNAFEQLNTKTEAKVLAPVSPKVNAVVDSIDQEKLVNDLANTGYWLGQNLANAIYYGEANSTIESEDIEMLKTSKDVRKIISTETRKLAAVRPNASPQTLEVLVKNRLKQYTYLGGNLVAPLQNGKSIREVMGLPESTEESYTPNTALKKYFDRPDFVEGLDKVLTAERQSQQGWWSNLGENISEFTSDYVDVFSTKVSNPFVAAPNRVVRDFNRVSTLPYKLDVDINGRAVVSFYHDTGRTKAYTQPISIDLKEVGDWYNNTLKEELRPTK